MPRQNHRARLEELKALRKSGKKAFDSYQPDEIDDLYDEVDEDGYKKIVRERLNKDDFVVDDNGEGYADDGREDWDRVQRYESDSEEEIHGRGRPSKTGEPAERPNLQTCNANFTKPRKPAKTNNRSATPTTETSARTSRPEPRPRLSPRLSRRRTMMTSWLVFSARLTPTSQLQPDYPSTSDQASVAKHESCPLRQSPPPRRGSPSTQDYRRPLLPTTIKMMSLLRRCPWMTTSRLSPLWCQLAIQPHPPLRLR